MRKTIIMLLLPLVTVCMFGSCSYRTFAPMLTKEYIPVIKEKQNNSNKITKNGVTIIVEPRDINEYFNYRNDYEKQVATSSGSSNPKYFPLVVNLFEGLSVFKITIQNEGTLPINYNFSRDDDNNNFIASFNGYLAVPVQDFGWVGFDAKKFAVYDKSKEIIGYRYNANGEYPQLSIQNAISDVVYNVQQRNDTPLLNRLGGLIVRGQETLVGYIAFPEVIGKTDAELIFTINGEKYQFDVNLTPQYYKSVYNSAKSNYMPYEIITQNEYNLIMKDNTSILKKQKIRNGFILGGIIVVIAVGSIFGA